MCFCIIFQAVGYDRLAHARLIFFMHKGDGEGEREEEGDSERERIERGGGV